MGDKTYDLSKSMGGLSREEYRDLDEKDRKQLDRRLRSYADQNAKENHANIKGNSENIVPLDVNSVKKKTNDVSMNTSYEEGGDETVVVRSRSQTSNNSDSSQSSKNLVTVSSSTGGGNDEIGDALYKGG